MPKVCWKLPEAFVKERLIDKLFIALSFINPLLVAHLRLSISILDLCIGIP